MSGFEEVAAHVRAAGTGLGHPLLVGIAGPVAVGKSTLAAALRAALSHAPALLTTVVATDGFLYPNDVLAPQGLLAHKGFPATYDLDTLRAFQADVRGKRTARAPRYSHATYDRVPGEYDLVEGGDVVIIEGVNALQTEVAAGLDLAIYLDAPETLVREWYVTRFLEQIVAAETDTGSFYRRFCALARDEREATAGFVWDTVNGVNLREHIEPTRQNAHVVVHKAAGHAITEVEVLPRASARGRSAGQS